MSSGGNDMTRNVKKKNYKFGVICDERCKARIFLLVDLQDFFSDLGSGGREKILISPENQ